MTKRLLTLLLPPHGFCARNVHLSSSNAHDGEDWKHKTNFFNNLHNKKSFGSVQKSQIANPAGYNEQKDDDSSVAHWTRAVHKDK